MSDKHVLYLGDTSLSGAAAYLAGLMTRFRIGFDYLPSDKPLTDKLAKPPRKLFILSDYASKMIDAKVQTIILDQVTGGAGLLMIGGWESFHGHGGDWDGTAIGDALPIEISGEDDRVNCDQTALAICVQDHPITADLPWQARTPTIGGFNRVTAKENAATLLEVLPYQVRHSGNGYWFGKQPPHPLLVVGEHGKGRTAAFMTDLAPHWVGGLVDWGDDERVTAQAAGSWQIEVGNLYSQFVANMLAWTGQLHTEPL